MRGQNEGDTGAQDPTEVVTPGSSSLAITAFRDSLCQTSVSHCPQATMGTLHWPGVGESRTKKTRGWPWPITTQTCHAVPRSPWAPSTGLMWERGRPRNLEAGPDPSGRRCVPSGKSAYSLGLVPLLEGPAPTENQDSPSAVSLCPLSAQGKET